MQLKVLLLEVVARLLHLGVGDSSSSGALGSLDAQCILMKQLTTMHYSGLEEISLMLEIVNRTGEWLLVLIKAKKIVNSTSRMLLVLIVEPSMPNVTSQKCFLLFLIPAFFLSTEGCVCIHIEILLEGAV